jgi:2-polyprenyl-6-methoxyphenol hydroxylase-like FAD-dependent oxidoreductase|tara:strand:- start:2919 stop:4124 length:1206 start_codon:yes stop_codon:yes gene_type:complete
LPTATIIGGSIAGLFTANALIQKGWNVTVHEKVESPLSGRGAGIATYDELADLVFKATGNNQVLGTKAKTRVSLDIKGNINSSYDYPQVYTSWQHLFSLLRNNIKNSKYFMNDDCIKIIQDNESATALFFNGKKKKSDIIIIANGMKSVIRKYVDQNAIPQYAGYIGWRGVVNEKDISVESLKILSEYFVVVLPFNQQIASYPIAGEGENPFDKGNRRINWIWYKPATEKNLKKLFLGKSGKQYNDGIPPNEIRDQVLKELLLEAKNILPPQMYELIIKTSQPLIQPIYDLESNFMVNKRLITIGDAAFTARPHVGMGVTKAAIDAFSLSNSLSSNNYLNSLSKWEKDRIKAGKFLVNRSRELGIYLSKPMKNETLIMPDILNVLSDTAISLYEIKNYTID